MHAKHILITLGENPREKDVIAYIARHLNLFWLADQLTSRHFASASLANPLSGNNNGGETNNRPVLAKNLALAFLFHFFFTWCRDSPPHKCKFVWL